MLGVVDLTNPIYRGVKGLEELLPPFLDEFKKLVGSRVMVVKPRRIDAAFPDDVTVVEHDEPLLARQIPTLAARHGFYLAPRETIVISFDSLWVDPVGDELQRFEAGEHTACLLYTQPGVQLALFRHEDLTKLGPRRAADLEGKLRTMQGAGEADFSRLRPIGAELYLCVDFPDSLAFLLEARRNKQSRERWVRKLSLRIFTVQNYKKLQSFIRKLNMLKPLEGRRILEVGASTSQSTIADVLYKEFEIKSYTGINIENFSYELDYPNSELLTMDIHKYDPATRYDVVFSFAAWEHIHDPLPIIKKIPSWLARGGVHYGIFFCWSGATGHHITREREGAHLVSFFDHLRLSEPELRSKLTAAGASSEVIDDIAQRMFHSDYINRVRAKDFLNALMTCGLEVVYLDLRNGGHYHPSLQEQPSGLGDYSNEELSVNGFEFLLRRSAYDWRSILTQAELAQVAQTKVSY